MSESLVVNELQLWCVFYADISDAALLGEYRQLLSEAERQQEPRFYFADDQRRYLVTRALVRTVLSRYADIAPRDWSFGTNSYGRPWILNEWDGAQALSFNITHTKGLIILIVADGREVGVDAENVRIRQVSLGVADRFFSAGEVATLRSLPAEYQSQRFLEYWTLKESYIKARGKGLSIPLDEFGFQLTPDERVSISIHPNQNDSPGRWLFRQFWITQDYLAAVCAERGAGAVPALTLKQVVPLVSSQPLEYRRWRASAD